MSDRVTLTLLCLTAIVRLGFQAQALGEILGAWFLLRLTFPNRFLARDSAIART